MTDSPQNCCDCGGFDIEWMYRCEKHGTEHCRSCSCLVCEEDDFDDYGLDFDDDEGSEK